MSYETASSYLVGVQRPLSEPCLSADSPDRAPVWVAPVSIALGLPSSVRRQGVDIFDELKLPNRVLTWSFQVIKVGSRLVQSAKPAPIQVSLDNSSRVMAWYRASYFVWSGTFELV